MVIQLKQQSLLYFQERGRNDSNVNTTMTSTVSQNPHHFFYKNPANRFRSIEVFHILSTLCIRFKSHLINIPADFIL